MTLPKAIDFLCNHFSAESIRRNYVDSEAHDSFERVGRGSDFQGYEPAEFLDMLSQAGVEKVLIAAIITWSYRKQRPLEFTSADDVAEAVTAFPEQIFGLYGVNPWSAMDGVRDLENVVRTHGFKGIHIHPHGFGFPPDHAFYFPFYAKCQELGIAAVVSMGTTLDLMPIENGRPVHLDRIALYFPDLKIVCAHTGWPWVEEAIALASKHPNLYLGTSAHAPKYWKAELVRFLDSGRGRRKVLWGTDWPLLRHRESLDQVEALDLKEDTKRALLHDNAAEVFNI